MATMKDARDIFSITLSEDRENINAENSTPHLQQVKKQIKKSNHGIANRAIKALREGERAQKITANQQQENAQGYKQMKAKLGVHKVRPWKLTAFKNPAREDEAEFYHWTRVGEENKPYPFAKFNQKIELPEFTDMEYWAHLDDGAQSDWTLEETRHFIELCKRFDLRFILIKDRYNTQYYPARSIEDLKMRYYSIENRLTNYRAAPGEDLSNKFIAYDAEHEKLRKDQLEKFYMRSQDEVDQHDLLVEQLKKLEFRKKERDRKATTAQKLLAIVDNTSDDSKSEKTKKNLIKKKDKLKKDKDKAPKHLNRIMDERGAGPYLRSYRLKVPNTMTNRRAKAMDLMLEELNVGVKPIATEKVTSEFNVLRNNILLLLELRTAQQAAEYELESLKQKNDNFPSKYNPDALSTLISSTTEDTPTSSQQFKNSPSKPSSGRSTPNSLTSRKRKQSFNSLTTQELAKKNKFINN